MASLNTQQGKELTGKYLGTKPRLMQELKDLQKEKFCNIELDNGDITRWTIGLMVINAHSQYNGAYFLAKMTFPDTYPYAPPTFRFVRPIYHPNIYEDGRLCISILHAPGEDLMSGEAAEERWGPLQGIESVLRSVLLLLDDPECSSPANVDAGVMYRNDRQAFIKKAKEDVKVSQRDIPEGFIMPTTLIDVAPEKEDHDADFWQESGDEEDDFGGSSSSDMEDGDQEFEDDSDEEGDDVEMTEDEH